MIQPSVHEKLERLPAPATHGGASLSRCLAERRSRRSIGPAPLPDAALGQLLWATQGITARPDQRASPSAGALYPLELYVARITGTERYLPAWHALQRLDSADARPRLCAGAHGQDALRRAPVVIALAAVWERTRRSYGRRAERFVWLEAGHAAQNLLLQATALGLATVPIGAFDDSLIRDALRLSPRESPLYLIPIGIPAADS